MANKEQLLQYFQTLSVPTLEKLEKYSKLLIIPDEDLLVNATMSQMVAKAHDLADVYFPDWTDRSKSDFGEFLVELFAIFSEKDFWYINAFANEGILRKMRSYGNAFSKVSSMGYRPVTCKGSVGTFNVTFGAGEELTYLKGDLVVDVKGTRFTNDTPFTLPTSATTTSLQLELHEGEQMAEDVTYNGYSVFIRKANIDLDSVAVFVDNTEYTRVANFGLSSNNSTHFMIIPEEDGSVNVYFGENGFGAQPEMGRSIRVEYRLCHGVKGNIGLSLVEVNSSLDSRPAISSSMVTTPRGGLDAETLTSIRERAPLYFTTKRSAINEVVSQDIINSFSFVQKSKVIVIGRNVTYRIIPTSGSKEPNEDELAEIENEFHPYLMAGYTGVHSPNDYVDLVTAVDADSIVLDVIVLKGYTPSSVEESIRQIMDDITNPLVRADYGGKFSKTETDVIIRSSVAGVQNVSFRISKDGVESPMDDVVLGDNEIFTPISQDKLTIRINVV